MTTLRSRLSLASWSTMAPVAGIANVGFAFSDYAQVWNAIDGDLGKLIATQIEKTGAVVMAKPADNTFRQISSFSKPFTSLDLASSVFFSNSGLTITALKACPQPPDMSSTEM